MGVYVKNWSLADWKELLKWAKIGANNAMIGEFTEVEELPPHGRLIDADALEEHDGWLRDSMYFAQESSHTHIKFIYANDIINAPTVIEAEECE